MKVLLCLALVCLMAVGCLSRTTKEDMLKALDRELLFDILQEDKLNNENDDNECAGKDDGDYSYSKDCSKYITCSNGIIHIRNCPQGLYFNRRTSQCDFIYNVNCTSTNKGDCSGKRNGDYPDPNDCYGFITCSNGVPHKMNCPAKLKFDPKTKRCEHGDNVVCTAKDDTMQDPSNVPSKDPFCMDKKNGTYVNPFECEGFIMCSNHLTYFFDCPSILQYNPKTKRCDWPRNVKCGPTPAPTTKPPPPPPTPSGSGFCKRRKNGNYVDPNNCNGFIMCSNHLTYFFDCPANLRYNAKTDRCDWPWNVECGPTPAPTTKPPPTPSGSGFCKRRKNGNYVDPNNCNGFIMCSNHLTYFFDCPANLRYNAKTDRCDWPWNVKCGPTPAPTTKPPPTPSGSGFCKRRKDGNYVDPNNCNGFIMCSNHLTYFFDCPANLRYNAKKDQCDWPRNVKCLTAPQLRDTIEETDKDKAKFCIEHGDGNYRDVTNCEGYFTCFKGFQIFRECPGTKRFNPLTKRCDLPRNVKCGGAGGGTRGSHFCLGKKNDDYKDKLNCNGFIKCSNGYTYYFDCPSILRFNKRKDQCDWPRNVKCSYED